MHIRIIMQTSKTLIIFVTASQNEKNNLTTPASYIPPGLHRDNNNNRSPRINRQVIIDGPIEKGPNVFFHHLNHQVFQHTPFLDARARVPCEPFLFVHQSRCLVGIFISPGAPHNFCIFQSSMVSKCTELYAVPIGTTWY